LIFVFFFLTETAPTTIYPLSLHDALPISQTKILREPIAGAMHATIFWGFLVLTVGTIELLISGVFPAFSYGSFLPAPLFAGYELDRKSTRLNSSHVAISYAVFCLKKKK